MIRLKIIVAVTILLFSCQKEIPLNSDKKAVVQSVLAPGDSMLVFYTYTMDNIDDLADFTSMDLVDNYKAVFLNSNTGENYTLKKHENLVKVSDVAQEGNTYEFGLRLEGVDSVNAQTYVPFKPDVSIQDLSVDYDTVENWVTKKIRLSWSKKLSHEFYYLVIDKNSNFLNWNTLKFEGQQVYNSSNKEYLIFESEQNGESYLDITLRYHGLYYNSGDLLELKLARLSEGLYDYKWSLIYNENNSGPILTNVKNGLGYFGAMSSTSLFVDL